MTEKEMENSIKYWEIIAEHDYKTMLALFKSKEYSNTLFFGHIVLEKVLKGLVVKETKKQAPFTHDLVRLAETIDSGLDKKEMLFLNDVNEFNIRARYPEKKLAFYKKCTLKYTEGNLEKIKSLYKKLCQKLK
jgi:HEPN domain-containing protein